MTLNNLRDLIDLLREEGDLVEVAAPVDPYLEIAEIHRRVIAAGGPALLFANVKGSPYPVVTNLFGTARRIELAFGRRPVEFVRRAVQARAGPPPAHAGEAVGLPGLRAPGPRAWGSPGAGAGPVLEVVECPARPGHPPGAHLLAGRRRPVRHPAPGVHRASRTRTAHGHNLGMYRLHVYDRQTTGMHWQIQKGGGFHHAGRRAPAGRPSR